MNIIRKSTIDLQYIKKTNSSYEFNKKNPLKEFSLAQIDDCSICNK